MAVYDYHGMNTGGIRARICKRLWSPRNRIQGINSARLNLVAKSIPVLLKRYKFWHWMLISVANYINWDYFYAA
jgi:hypothetical protein